MEMEIEIKIEIEKTKLARRRAEPLCPIVVGMVVGTSRDTPSCILTCPSCIMDDRDGADRVPQQAAHAAWPRSSVVRQLAQHGYDMFKPSYAE